MQVKIFSPNQCREFENIQEIEFECSNLGKAMILENHESFRSSFVQFKIHALSIQLKQNQYGYISFSNNECRVYSSQNIDL